MFTCALFPIRSCYHDVKALPLHSLYNLSQIYQYIRTKEHQRFCNSIINTKQYHLINSSVLFQFHIPIFLTDRTYSGSESFFYNASQIAQIVFLAKG